MYILKITDGSRFLYLDESSIWVVSINLAKLFASIDEVLRALIQRGREEQKHTWYTYQGPMHIVAVTTGNIKEEHIIC